MELLEAIKQGLLSLKNGRIIDDESLAALTIYLEARGEGQDGKVAVGEVIRNRMKEAKAMGNISRDEVFEVVFAPYQFSCWNTDAPGRAKALSLRKDDPMYSRCVQAWRESSTSNITRGANHYLNPATVIKTNGSLPSWASINHLTVTIGNHNFYKL